MYNGPFKTVTGKLEPVTIDGCTMRGPVLYYTDPTWMDVWTMVCDCHNLTWFDKDIWSAMGLGLLCPLTPKEVPA